MFRAEREKWPFEDLSSYSTSSFVSQNEESISVESLLAIIEDDEFQKAIEESSQFQIDFEKRKKKTLQESTDEAIASIMQKDLEEENVLNSVETDQTYSKISNSKPLQSSSSSQEEEYLDDDEILALMLQSEHQISEDLSPYAATSFEYPSEDEDLSIEEPELVQDNDISLDSMTYEQLLELEEKMGKVETGVHVLTLSSFPTYKFSNVKQENNVCLICQEKYKIGDNLRFLPCCDSFHVDCIDQWLAKKKTCPKCLKDVHHSK